MRWLQQFHKNHVNLLVYYMNVNRAEDKSLVTSIDDAVSAIMTMIVMITAKIMGSRKRIAILGVGTRML